MSVRFALKVPNDDDGEHLGCCKADCLPRVGDDIYVYSKRLMGKSDYPFEGVVDAVAWEVRQKEDGNDLVVDLPTVWIRGRAQAPLLYCVCTDEERAELVGANAANPDALLHACDDDAGNCFNCGATRP